MPITAKQLDSSHQLIVPLAINAQVDVGTYTAIGGDEFNPSLLPLDGRKIEFIARVYTTNTSIDGYVRLYNISDGVEVSTTELIGNSLTPERLSVVLTAGGTGFPNSDKTYEVQLKMKASNGSDSVFCQKAELKVTWTQ